MSYSMVRESKFTTKLLIKFHPRSGNEGPEGEERCSSTLSLTLALDGGGWLTPRPGRFIPWMARHPSCRRLGGPQGGLECSGLFRPIGFRFPDRPARRESQYRLIYRGLLNLFIPFLILTHLHGWRRNGAGFFYNCFKVIVACLSCVYCIIYFSAFVCLEAYLVFFNFKLLNLKTC